jgi:hypothetical protein
MHDPTPARCHRFGCGHNLTAAHTPAPLSWHWLCYYYMASTCPKESDCRYEGSLRLQVLQILEKSDSSLSKPSAIH